MEQNEQNFDSKEINLKSFYKNQFFIGMGLILVGVTDLIIFGGSLGSRYLLLGSTFQFQGPSYFYSIGLIPMILGLSFIIHSGLTLRRLTIDGFENKIQITESYFYRKKSIEIPKKQILYYKLTNSALNIQYFLLLILIPYFSFNFNNGIGNLALHQTSDFPITGTTLIISILTVLILIVTYISRTIWRLTIYTEKGYFILKFSPLHCENQDSLMESIKNKFQFVNRKLLKLKQAHNNHLITIGVVVALISFYNILFSHLLISFIENLNAWLAFYVGIIIILRETKRNKTKIVEFVDDEKNQHGFKQRLILTKIGVYVIPFIVSINSLLAIICNWIGVFNNSAIFWRALISTFINLILISANVYYFFMFERKKLSKYI